MKNKTLLIITLTFLIVKLCFSQKKYFGINGSVGFDVHELHDSKNNISAFPAISPSWGINAGYVINDAFHVEAGLNKKDYYFEFGSLNEEKTYFGSGFSYDTFQFSSKLISRLNLYHNRFYLAGRIGIKLGFNLNSTNFGGGDVGSCYDEYVSIEYVEKATGIILFPLLESGLGFDIRLYENTFLFFTTNYNTGFRNVYAVDVEYTAFNYEQGTATGISKGSFCETLAGFKFYF